MYEMSVKVNTKYLQVLLYLHCHVSVILICVGDSGKYLRILFQVVIFGVFFNAMYSKLHIK